MTVCKCNNLKLTVVAGLLIGSVLMVEPALAGGLEDLQTNLKAAATTSAGNITSQAIKLFWALYLLQFILSNWKMVFRGDDLGGSLAKLAGSFTFAMFVVALVDHFGVSFLQSMMDGFTSLATTAGGSDITSPSKVLTQGKNIIHNMLAAYVDALGPTDLLNPTTYIAGGLLILCSLAVFVGFVIFAFALFSAQIEFLFVLAIAPISFSMAGLTAMREAGLAPLKSTLAIGYRYIILAISVNIIGSVAAQQAANLTNVSILKLNFDPVLDMVAIALAAVIMAFNAGKIAAALATGTSNLSGNEGLQAVGNAAGTIGNAAATMASAGAMMMAAGKALQGMASGGMGGKLGNMMDSLKGNQGSLRNASPAGNGAGGGGSHDVGGPMPGGNQMGEELGQSPVGGEGDAGGGSSGGGSGGDGSSAGIGGGSDPTSRMAAALEKIQQNTTPQSKSRTEKFKDAMRNIQNVTGEHQVADHSVGHQISSTPGDSD